MVAGDRSTRTLLRRPLPGSQAPGVSPRRRLHRLAAALISGYLLAAAVIVAVHGFVTMPQWLALHLLVLGAATNAVFVYSRHFAQALLHVKPAPERPAYIRLALLNVGVVAVLCGMSEGVTWPAVAGAATVVGAVVAHVGSLVAMARAATLSGRLRVVVWFYVAGGIALAVGGSLGGLLASGTVSSQRWEQAVRLAHAHLNVLGWLGLVIVGTQFMLWPAVLRTKMAEDTPIVARRVLRATVGGLGVAVAGLLLTAVSSAGHWLAVLGMFGYTAGVACSWIPAIREARVKPPRSAAAVTLLLGNAWLIAALLVDVVGLVRGAAEADDLLGRLLVPALGIGSVAQILIGALMFLLPVTLGGGPVGNRRMTSVLGYAWIPRNVLGNAGVLMLMLPVPASARPVAWVMVLAEFASFPVLVAASMVASRRPASELPPHAADDSDQARRGQRTGIRPLAISSVVVVLTGLAAVGISIYGGKGPSGPAVAAASGVPVAVTLDEFAIKGVRHHRGPGHRSRARRAQHRPDAPRPATGRGSRHPDAGARRGTDRRHRRDAAQRASLVHRVRPQGSRDDPRHQHRRSRHDITGVAVLTIVTVVTGRTGLCHAGDGADARDDGRREPGSAVAALRPDSASGPRRHRA